MKYGLGDLGKTYPGSRVQKSPDPGYCMIIVVQEKFLSLSRPAETEGAEEVGNIWFLVVFFSWI